jgi:hypothetical protein
MKTPPRRGYGPSKTVVVLRSAAVLMSLFVATGPARGQPAKVEDLIRQAVELRKAGANHRALPLFQQAYDIERSPRTAAQLGLAEASLGYWLSAEEHLGEALQSTRNPWVATHETQLRGALKSVQASIGEVEITGTPTGAAVTVNGQPAGKLPLRTVVRVPEGGVQVTVQADGHKPATKRSGVEGGKRTVLKFELEPSMASGSPTTPLTESKRAPSTGSPTERPGRSVPQESSWLRPASYFVGAAAVGALAVGGYGLLAERQRGKEFDRHANPSCGDDLPQKGGSPCETIHRRVQSARKLAVGGFVVGGALVAAAVIGFVASSPSHEGTGSNAAERASLSIGLGDGRATPLSVAWNRPF